MLILVLVLVLPLTLQFTVHSDTHHTYYVGENNTVTTRPVGPITAYVEFKDLINTTGWSMLTVNTNASYADKQQAHAAGIGEGYATATRILQSWLNSMSGYCTTPSDYCNKLKAYMDDNANWISSMIQKHAAKSQYWYHMELLLLQIEGLQVGFNMVYPDRLTVHDFYLMNLSGDLEDLEIALGAEGLAESRARKRPVFQSTDAAKKEYMLGTGSCSAFIKWLPDDLLTSQITWNSYQNMLRIVKHYQLNYRSGPDAPATLMSGRRQVFSGYPGYVASGDDYTLIGSGLVAQETTIGNSNAALWEYVRAEGSVPEYMRSVLANRLAEDGKSWCGTFEQYNSGTYNNQWMIVDYNKFTPGASTLQSGTLYVLEQIPGTILFSDRTEVLSAQKYWPSYNTPSYPHIFKLSGCQESVDKYGPMFAYETTPRALIFRRDNHTVTDMESLYKLMRYNDYKQDPLAQCECSPPYSAENAIAARSDLNPANGTYLLPFLGHRLHGATDYKGTNVSLMKKLGMRVVGGPTSEQQPPFRWSTSDWANTSHIGMVDLQQFQEMTIVFDERDIVRKGYCKKGIL